MGHHALVGLPALASDEMKKGVALLSSAEQQIEELVDEGIVGRERKAVEHGARDGLKQVVLESGSRALDDEAIQSMPIARGVLQRQHPAKRHAENGWRLQALPIDKLRQVVDEVGQLKRLPKRETI